MVVRCLLDCFSGFFVDMSPSRTPTNLKPFDVRCLSIVDISRVSVHKGVGFVLLLDCCTHCERSEIRYIPIR